MPVLEFPKSKLLKVIACSGVRMDDAERDEAASRLANAGAEALREMLSPIRKKQRGRGRPAHSGLDDLVKELCGIWADLPHEEHRHAVPGMTGKPDAREYSGPFVDFLQAYFALLAEVIEISQWGPKAKTFTKQLAEAATNSGKVRDRFRRTAFPRLRQIAADMVQNNDISPIASGAPGAAQTTQDIINIFANSRNKSH